MDHLVSLAFNVAGIEIVVCCSTQSMISVSYWFLYVVAVPFFIVVTYYFGKKIIQRHRVMQSSGYGASYPFFNIMGKIR